MSIFILSAKVHQFIKRVYFLIIATYEFFYYQEHIPETLSPEFVKVL